eukprot:CAMPEP_0196762724 /NCGR_PEP_ID=MMETSP1095-20130614/2653_1 /TAXON_ID=96789 ORGANISM="Chromulina nebulosa, Strain UTEXLB2642" /NCGR_SAMPLE_ID=MMETSP1095 /ASSEMBLY_ACC=CAM_ASM_000446 /LENGTH=1168 /DNA_ID=CAMNT_0042114379 /DNA_START=78 /DNA_END=3584 /DNA_ORIENTATION=-
MAVEGKFARIHFRVHCESQIGQEVTIYIAINDFGTIYSASYKPLLLVTTPQSYPIWYSSDPVVVPKGSQVLYKFGLMEQGDLLAYEGIPDNAINTLTTDRGNYRVLSADMSDTLVDDTFDLTQLDLKAYLPDYLVTAPVYSNVASSQDLVDNKSIENVDSPETPRLIIVCYHLPILIKRNPIDSSETFSITWAESLIAKSDQSISTSLTTYWLGTMSVPGAVVTDDELADLTERLKLLNCIPIFLPSELSRNAYHGFCKEVLWTVFHNVDPLDQIHAAWKLGDLSSPLDWNSNVNSLYESYLKVNQIFSDTVNKYVRSGDCLWVHDYHLMLLPKLVRETQESKESFKVNIVFFLHIPFPTSQIFRSLSCSTELLMSMSSADVVGFHTFDHARHFLTAMKRILGIRSHTKPGGLLALSIADREVIVTVSHVSIETNLVDKVLSDPLTFQRALDIRLKYGVTSILDTPSLNLFRDVNKQLNIVKKRMIVGIDVCQRLSGGVLKLAAYEKLLTDAPHEKDLVTLVQFNVRSNSRLGDESTTSKDMIEMVQRINNKFNSNYHASALDSVPGSQFNSTKSSIYGSYKMNEGMTKTPSIVTLSSDNILEDRLLSGEGVRGNVSSFSFPQSTEPHSPVIYYEELSLRSMSLSERVALWLAADLYLLTPIKEGLNLYPLEYIYVRNQMSEYLKGHIKSGALSGQLIESLMSSKGITGSVVVSEFSTCSSLLNGSLKINPYYTLKVADTLHKALYMNSNECAQRFQRDMNFITSHPSSKWTREILSDIVDLSNISTHSSISLTSNLSTQIPLNKERLLSSYLSADFATRAGVCNYLSRVFVFDYGGTLLHKEKFDIYIKQTLSAISGRKPTDRMMAAIRAISNDPRNAVLIVTGLTKLKLGDTFSDMRNVTLATSNGLVYSWGDNLRLDEDDNRTRSSSLVDPKYAMTNSSSFQNSSNKTSTNSLVNLTVDEMSGNDMYGSGRKWNALDYNIDWQVVREIAVPIITKFTFRTNGTCQTPRIPGIGWSYFGADPDWGEKQSTQCKIELEAALAKHDVKIMSMIQGSIEVVPKQLHKGVITSLFLNRIQQKRANRLPAFALVIGDEVSDDFMHDSLYNHIASSLPGAGLRNFEGFTVTVGKRDGSPALYYTNDVTDVENLLVALQNATNNPSSDAINIQ